MKRFNLLVFIKSDFVEISINSKVCSTKVNENVDFIKPYIKNSKVFNISFSTDNDYRFSGIYHFNSQNSNTIFLRPNKKKKHITMQFLGCL